MRFETSRALDAVEGRLSTDPLMCGAVMDLTEAARLTELDNGRPANLLRVGVVIDALAARLSDGVVALYAIADRSLLSDTDLTSNERMVVRRWSDDGLVEVLPAGGPVQSRLCEVAALTGLPVISRAALPPGGYARFELRPAPGSVVLSGAGGAPVPGRPALARLWRCPEFDCPSYGTQRQDVTQPPPRLIGDPAARPGTGDLQPTCPRHGERLLDAGARPATVAMTVVLEGVAVSRLTLVAGEPVTVGRSPDGADGVRLGPYLNDRQRSRVSRSHLTLELRAEGVFATDLSTNGSTVVAGDGSRRRLDKGVPQALDGRDVVELVSGVEVAQTGYRVAEPSGESPHSVMAEAPTMAIRLPPGPRR